METTSHNVAAGPWGLALTAFLSAVLAGLSVAAFVVVRNAEYDQLANQGFQGAFGLLNSIRNARPKGHGEVRGIVENYRAEGIRSVAVIGKNGLVLAASDPEHVGGFITTSHFRKAHRTGEIWSGFIESPSSKPAFRMYVPVKHVMGRPRWKHRRGPPPPWGGFKPREMVVGIEVDITESFWLWNWVWAQAAVCLVTVLTLWLAFFRTRRAALAIATLEAERRRHEELARLGKMSAVLAHELRNPLGALKGHLQLALEGLDDKPYGQGVARRLNTTLVEITRIETLIRGLLDYARDRPLERVRTGAKDLVTDAVGLSRPTQDEDLPEPRIEGPDDLVVAADPDQVARALANVIRNAMEAAGADGTVVVRFGENRNGVAFTVEDSGPGLDVGLGSRAFDPFVTGKLRGVGLGLAVARQVAEAHGGRIEAGRSSELGGARFTLVLPSK